MSKIYSALIPPAAGRAEGSPPLAATTISVFCDTPLLAAG